MPVRVEFAKMRRLRVWLLAALISAATLAFSAMQLFSPSYVARINDPATGHWGAFLLFYAMIKAMTAPILAAVLASRQVEIEHQGNGWTMAATLGLSRGRLCLTKIAALTPIVAVTSTFELGGLVVASRLAGARVPLPTGSWAWYAAASFAVTMVLLAGSVWLAARVEQQLVTLGIGVLGAFVGVFTMLMPEWLAMSLPWGYYAVTVPYAMTGVGAPVDVAVPWPFVTSFFLLSAAILAAGFRLLDREA